MDLSPVEVTYQEAHIRADRGPAAVGVSVTFLVVTTACVAVRVHVRRHRQLGPALDDLLILLSLLVILGEVVCVGILVRYGLGKHLITLQSSEEINKFGRTVIAYACFYTGAISLIKIAILSFYRGAFPFDSNKWFGYLCYTIVGYIFLWTVASYLIIFLSCQPLSTFWSTQHHCTISRGAGYSVAILNLLSDFAVVTAPLPILWNRNPSRTMRVNLCLLFTFGLGACMVGLARVPELYGLFQAADLSYKLQPSIVLGVVEPSTGVIAACLPICGCLVEHVGLSSLFKQSHASNDGDEEMVNTTGSISVTHDIIIRHDPASHESWLSRASRSSRGPIPNFGKYKLPLPPLPNQMPGTAGLGFGGSYAAMCFHDTR